MTSPPKALFSDIGDVYRVEFFHPGWMFKKPVRFYTMREGNTAAVPFDRGLFDYGKLNVPANVVNPEGYAGFRVVAPEALQKRRFEFLVFMGASYYRFGGMMKGYIRRVFGDALVDRHLEMKRQADPAMILNRDVIF